jgi:hypothetical protein
LEIWGEGVGSCSTLETKFRYRKAEQTCPKCGKPTIIKGKKEYGGGWLCYQKKGGCGAKFVDGDKDIENQNMGRIEHDNPADYYNTVLKMAKKRAQVDAILTATAASDIFTQDVEEMVDNGVITINEQPSAKASIPEPPLKKKTNTYEAEYHEEPPPSDKEFETEWPAPKQQEPAPDENDNSIDGLRAKIRHAAAQHFDSEMTMSAWLKKLTTNEEKGYTGITQVGSIKSLPQAKFILGSLRKKIADNA